MLHAQRLDRLCPPLDSAKTPVKERVRQGERVVDLYPDYLSRKRRFQSLLSFWQH